MKLPSLQPSVLRVSIVTVIVGLGIGAVVALASSPGSISARVGYAKSTTPPISPASPSPSPSVPPAATAVGQLGDHVSISVYTGALLRLSGSTTSAESMDGGLTWHKWDLGTGAPVAVSPVDAGRMVRGGTRLEMSTDGGLSWRATRTVPLPAGPYLPLAVSGADPTVWFVSAQKRLFRTRDDGVSWKEIKDVSADSTSVMVGTPKAGQFVIVSGGSVMQLEQNGDVVIQRGAPSGAGSTLDLAAIPGAALGLVVSAGGAIQLSSTDQVKGWTRLPAPVAGPVAAGADRIEVGDGARQLGSAGAVSVSTDGGQTWRSASGLPRDQGVVALAIGSTLDYAYCLGGDFYVSNDGGVTWQLRSLDLRAGGALSTVGSPYPAGGNSPAPGPNATR